MKRSTKVGMAMGAVVVAAVAWVVGNSAVQAARQDLPFTYVLKSNFIVPTCEEVIDVQFADVNAAWAASHEDPGHAEFMRRQVRRQMVETCRQYHGGR